MTIAMSLGIGAYLGAATPVKGGGGWSPTDLGDDLLAWWNADRSDLIAVSGAQITSWKDVVAGREAVQPISASRPIWSPNSFNGSPSAYFDGIDDELTFESQPFPAGADPSEIWAVVQQDALPADTTVRSVVTYGGIGANLRALRRITSGGVNRARAAVGNGTAVVNVDGDTVDFSSRHLIRAEVAPTATTVRIDNDGEASGAVVPSTGTTRLRLGANAVNTAANFWNGHIRDVLITGPLADEQSELLRTYLLPRRNV